MDLLTLPASPHQKGSSQKAFSSFLWLSDQLYLVLLPMLEKWHFKFRNETREKDVQDLYFLPPIFYLCVTFWWTSIVFQCCWLYSSITQLKLCKSWNKREFMLCYRRTALLPAAMKQFHEQKLRYGGGDRGRGSERRHLRKKKDAKQLLLFIIYIFAAFNTSWM